MKNRAQSTADGRHANNRRRAHVQRLTVGSLALQPTPAASPLNVSLYSQPTVLGKVGSMPKQDFDMGCLIDRPVTRQQARNEKTIAQLEHYNEVVRQQKRPLDGRSR